VHFLGLLNTDRHPDFPVNDAPRNPLPVALPPAGPLPSETRSAFVTHIQPLQQQLALAREVAPARVATRD